MHFLHLNEHAISGGVHYKQVCYFQPYRLQPVNH